MESFFGNPWDFGTGFMQPPTFMPGASTAPVMPQVDLAAQMAEGLASKGIRPQQFFANPDIARDVVAPPPMPTNEWDATPVATPGGAPMPLPGSSRGAAPMQANDAMQASAGGDPTAMKAAKEKTPAEKFAETLRGVKAPTPPAQQTVRTPGAPEPKGTIKTGELLSLLLAMQPQGAQAGLKLPPTLGASLKGVY